jgi:hypothetical protein
LRKTKNLPTVASWKTIKRLVSSIHLILNPPPTPSHSVKAVWISLVFNSFGKPVRERIRVTQAESWVSEEAMTKKDPRRSLRDREKETIEARFGRVVGEWNTGTAT